MDITVRIPAKPHIKKYLQVLYGHQFRFTKTHSFGILLLDLLNKKTEKMDRSFSDYHHYYTVIISERYLNSNGCTITRDKKKLLAVFFEKKFKENLRQFVDMEVSRSGSAMEAIRMFLRFHTITENEINLDSVYRDYQRYCGEKIKSKKNLSKVLALC